MKHIPVKTNVHYPKQELQKIFTTYQDNLCSILGIQNIRCTIFNTIGCTQDVLIRRWSQQRRLLALDVTRGIQYWQTAIRWYISCILSQLFHLNKYHEIKKFKNPSYLALAYLPQRQWMNYTTNRTLRLQSIHCPLRGKVI